ncbi:MAG: hypothetical protein IKP00_08055 [Victivallales bacterium]|nr:hypothetical protein [Victivallales bacterium]
MKSHQTDSQEIANLLAIVERDLTDASLNDLSVDWQFGIAYNAALKLCNIMLYVHGYRPENALAHYRAIMALKEIEEENWEQYSVYLNACRMRRNTLEYDCVDSISKDDAEELITFTRKFYAEVKNYLVKHFLSLL